MFPAGIWNYRGVRQPAVQLSTRTRALLVAGFVGLLIVLIVWWIGPGLFASADEPVERVVTASVSEPVSCTEPDAVEQVTFLDGDKPRTASLHACGHDKGEELAVAVPESPGPGALTVRSAETDAGHSNARRTIGLLLVALSCLGGGAYAFLVSQAGPCRRSSVHAV